MISTPRLLTACALAALVAATTAPATATAQNYDERPAKMAPRDVGYDYVRRSSRFRCATGSSCTP